MFRIKFKPKCNLHSVFILLFCCYPITNALYTSSTSRGGNYNEIQPPAVEKKGSGVWQMALGDMLKEALGAMTNSSTQFTNPLFGKNNLKAILRLSATSSIDMVVTKDLLADSESESKDPLIVELPNGKIRGRDNGNHYSFESIPYAEPPIGDLRFENPVPYTRKWASIFDATKPPALCMQWTQYAQGTDKLQGVEDCLSINVYVPKTKCTEGSSLKKKKLPVLAVIHGGAFMQSAINFIDQELFMERGFFIVVKFSYRLGPLGFISTEDNDLTGNYGLKDQLLAFKWIKENINNFGGDPNAIMAIGFSAGAASVHLHMLRPEFAQLVNVAVSSSGSVFSPWAITRNARARALKLAHILGCNTYGPSSTLKECLKSKSAEDIVRSVPYFQILDYNPFTIFGPVIENPSEPNAFITESPEETFKSGRFAQVPWLVSYTTGDGAYNAALLLRKDFNGWEPIYLLNQHWYELAPDLLFYRNAMPTMEEVNYYSWFLKQRYMGDKGFSVQTYHDLQLMYTDVLYKNGIDKSVHLQRLHSKAPIYAYMYDIPSDRSVATLLANRTDIKFGTVHADDTFMIFYGENVGKFLGQSSLTPTKRLVAQNLHKMLEGFIESNGKQLSYGDCTFVDNVGKQYLQILSISPEGCQNRNVLAFP